MNSNRWGSSSMDAIGWHSHIAAQFDAGYQTSRTFIERLKVWTRLISRYGPSDGEVLDAGCGSGVLSVVAARHARAVLGVDASREMVRLACEKTIQTGVTNAEFRTLRVEQLDELAPRQFDLILLSSVLEYVEDMPTAMRSLVDRLKPGGILVFSLPNTRSLYRQLESVVFAFIGRPTYLAFVKNQPDESEISATIRSAGLTEIEHDYYATTPVLSCLAKHARCSYVSENLVVYVSRKPDENVAS